MKFIILLSILSLTPLLASTQTIADEAIPHAHSHNDYLKKNPLWGALENGCSSIEIDVFAHEESLKVAHVGIALKKRKTIQELYISPLISYLSQNEWVYQNQSLVLMIDFKTSGEKTLPLLLELIKPYQDYFTYAQSDSIVYRPLQLVISGKGFSYEMIKELNKVYVFVDGSIQHCNNNYPNILIERASAKYGSIFSWKGKKEMPESDKEELQRLVAISKTCNTKLRFYAMPENENIWRTFLDAGVYWINVDNSKRFRKFFEKP
ncbi:MAG: hypothetical protein ACI9O4_002422 [Chitinophagales bacterium]|jgi:hypothetical protein